MAHAGLKAVATVIGSGVFLLVFNWWLEGAQLGKHQSIYLHWNYAHHSFFFLIPLFLLCLDRRRSRLYAITPICSRQTVGHSLLISLPLLTFPFVGHFLAEPLVLSRTATSYLISTAIYQLFFVAVGEELFFRGFWQGELNRAFGKPWRIGKTHFGWGVVTVALLFGISHLLNPFNPLQESYALNWQGLFYAGGFALVAGLLRERYDQLFPCIVLHASWMVYLTWILPAQSGTIAFNMAVGASFSLSFYFIIRGSVSSQYEQAGAARSPAENRKSDAN